MSLPYKPLTLGFKVKHLKGHRWLSTPVPNSSAVLSCLDPAPHLNTPELESVCSQGFCTGESSHWDACPPLTSPFGYLPSGSSFADSTSDPQPQVQAWISTPRAHSTVALGCEGSHTAQMWFVPHPIPPPSISHRVQQTMGFPVSDSTSSTKLSPCRWEVVFLNPEKAAGCRGHLPSPWDNRGGVSWAEGCPGWPASPGLASNIFTCGKNSLERNTMPRLTGSFV